MRRKLLAWLALLGAALCAWLFTNGRSTALALAAVAALPLLRWMVGRFFPPRQRPVPAGRRLVPQEDGDREETFEVRDYTPGDDIRRIHWKLSEKLDRTLVRLPVEEPTPALLPRTVYVSAPVDTPSPLLALLALGVYWAWWGALRDMAGVASRGLLPIVLGGLWCGALALLPKGRAVRWALAGTAVALGLFFLLWGRRSIEGGMVLLNRLFAASEAAEPYTYQMFDTQAGVEALWAAFLPLSWLLGLLSGGAVRWRRPWLLLLPTAGLWAAIAYLGVAPRWGWTLALCVALVPALLGLWERLTLPAAGAVMGTTLALCLLAAVLLPGALPGLTRWAGEARDTLALQTVAYSQQVQTAEPTPPPPEETQETELYRVEDTPAKLGGVELEWARALPAVLVILLFALLLFLPALWSDHLKKRRAKNRAWMTDGDCAAAIREGFAYTMRWLVLGGLPRENRLYSSYTREVEQIGSPQLGQAFAEVLPLWQEAAYSDHPMTEAQRGQMAAFSQAARSAVWDRLSRPKRLLARYLYAL